MKAYTILTFTTFLILAAPAAAGPLHKAAKDGDAAAIAELLVAGAVVYVQDAHGNTALHWAAENGHVAAIAALLAAGADVNAQNKEGLTPLQLALEHGNEAAVVALRRDIASISTIRSGIYTDTTCLDPNFMWVYVPDITIDIDRSGKGDSVSIGNMKPDSRLLVHGWQRFRNEYYNQEPFYYFLRMVTNDSVQLAWWNPGPRKMKEPPRSNWPKILPSTAENVGEHWELTTYTKCGSIPFPLSMLHGEPAAFLLSLEPAFHACRNAHPACIQKAFAAVDIFQDNALSTAEWARLIRVTLYFVLAFDESIKSEKLGATYAISLLTAPLVASAIVSSYDYNGDSKTSLEELLRAIAGQTTAAIPEIDGMDPDIREKLGQVMTIFRNLSQQVPGLK